MKEIELFKPKSELGKMKIEFYVKNKDMDLIAQYLEKFAKNNLTNTYRIELKKSTKMDILNHALSDDNYKRIVNFYMDISFLDSLLNEVSEIMNKGFDIRIAFKYGFSGNTILVNHNEVIEFVKQENNKIRYIIDNMYSDIFT